MKRISLALSLAILFSVFSFAPINAFGFKNTNGVVPEYPNMNDSIPVTYERHKLGINPNSKERFSYGAPAACQVILAKHGIYLSQEQIAKDLGTTDAGTAIGVIPAYLNKKIGWNAYPRTGEPGYRLDQIKSHDDADENKLWDQILQSVKYGDPIIFLIDTSKFDSNNPGMKYVVSNGYRFGITQYPKSGDTSKWREVVYFDTDPKEYDSYYGYEKAEFLMFFMDALVAAGGYYIW